MEREEREGGGEILTFVDIGKVIAEPRDRFKNRLSGAIESAIAISERRAPRVRDCDLG